MVAWTDVYTRVAAPPVVPHPFGLFSVATPTSPPDPHWQAGVEWLPVGCGAGSTDISWTRDPCIKSLGSLVDPGPKSDHLITADECVVSSAKPFTVYVYVTASGTSSDVAGAEARARFEAGEEWAVENFVWNAMADQQPPFAAAASPVEALAATEHRLATMYHGTGVIHMSRYTATLLSEQLLRVGGQIQTLIGTPVAVGGGYETGVNEGAAHSIFGSGAITVMRAPLDVYTAWERSVNDILTLVERTYVVMRDCESYLPHYTYDLVP